jgi:hypothetical protein
MLARACGLNVIEVGDEDIQLFRPNKQEAFACLNQVT